MSLAKTSFAKATIAKMIPLTRLPGFALPSASQRFTSGRWLISFFLFAFLLSAALAHAQDGTKDAPKDLGQASLEELGNIQVYGASKHMQSTSDAPSSVTVITADEIQKYDYRTLADILESVRGFYINYDRDYTFLGVRGFGRLGSWNSSILRHGAWSIAFPQLTRKSPNE